MNGLFYFDCSNFIATCSHIDMAMISIIIMLLPHIFILYYVTD